MYSANVVPLSFFVMVAAAAQLVVVAGVLPLAVVWMVRLAWRPVVLAGSGLVVFLVLTLALLLSGCGTAPLPAPTRLQVPAELLIPPQRPVLLHLASPLKRLGSTTSKTLNHAPLTGSGTSI